MGPVLSSELAAELQEKLKLSGPAARKRIERAKKANTIKAIENLKFRRNEQFLFLPEHAGTPQLIHALKQGLSTAESPLYDCLLAIQARGGMVLQTAFPVISSLPIMGKKHFWATDASKLLLSYELLQEKHNSLGACFQLNKEIFDQPAETRRLAGRQRAEQLCIQALLDWLRLQGMVTAEKATIRGDSEIAQFGFYAWDLVSPSYLHALTNRVEDRLVNGFVVADVCLGKTLTVAEIQYFLNKVIGASSPYNRPFISFLVGQFFDRDAFLLARKHGIMVTTPSNLFGADFGRMLEEVVDLLDKPDWQSEQQAIDMIQLMDRIAHYKHLEGLMGNVLADTFEMLVAHCNALDWGRPMFGRRFKDRTLPKDYDCDVLFKKPGKGTLGIECKKKNRNSLVSESEVNHWFDIVAPLIYDENQRDRYYKDAPCEFSIWTNSDFHTDAIALLERLKAKTRSFSITWKNGRDMKDILRITQDKKLLEAYKQYFDN